MTFIVPLDAPDTLYYDCEIHSAMTGTLFIIDPSAGIGSNLAATQTVTGPLTAGSTLTFTVTINNTGVSDQADNPGNEFSEIIPSQLTVVGANATSGTATTTPPANGNGGTVAWNGTCRRAVR